jgi:TusA-related sulfurtransferase/predicted peroxiredoxin
MTTTEVQAKLDMTGRSITTFIAYHAALRLTDMASGEVLEVVTDDYEPIEHDMKAWCAAVGHDLVDIERDAPVLRLRIAKGAVAAGPPKRVAMVVSDAGLEELLSPLAFSLAAALEGDEVSIYFQGPAVRVLANGFTARLHGWTRPFSLFARKGMARSGHIEPQEKLRQLQRLGAKFYACGGSLQHFRVSPEDLAFPDVPIVEYLTFMTVMREADVQLFVQ